MNHEIQEKKEGNNHAGNSHQISNSVVLGPFSLNHHILKNEFIQDCYCGSHLHGWESEFFMHLHYKICVCNSCHRKNRVKVSFIGSGLDDWELFRNRKETIESVIKKTQHHSEHNSHSHDDHDGHSDGHGLQHDSH